MTRVAVYVTVLLSTWVIASAYPGGNCSVFHGLCGEMDGHQLGPCCSGFVCEGIRCSISMNNDCTEGSQCHSKSCGKTGKCCQPDGQQCSKDFPYCCSGTCNEKTGACGLCSLYAASCNSNDDCCNKNCKPGKRGKRCCMEEGTYGCEPDKHEQCCGGNFCDRTRRCSTCMSVGQKCEHDAQCCGTGSVCLDSRDGFGPRCHSCVHKFCGPSNPCCDSLVCHHEDGICRSNVTQGLIV